MKALQIRLNDNLYYYLGNSNNLLKAKHPEINSTPPRQRSSCRFLPHDDDVDKNILRQFALTPEQLIINITENCNFRCKYCVYNKNYRHARGITQKTVKIGDVKLFLGRFLSSGRRSIISFYGGEPLLNFRLIKTIVSFCAANFGKQSYSLTTNGSLLNKHVVKFLVQHEFTLAVSIDFNEKLHDKNRLLQNGAKTFHIVKRNLLSIRKKYPEFYFKNVIFLSTFESYIDGEQSVDADLEKHKFKTSVTEKNGRALWVDKQRYWRFIAKNKIDKSDEQKEFIRIMDKIRTKQDIPFKHSAQFNSLLRIHYRKALPYNNIFGGCCLAPSLKKLFMATDGTYYICEKMDFTFPLGDLKSGLNHEKIFDVRRKFYEFKKKYCRLCWAKRLCSLCYATFAQTGNRFVPDTYKCMIERRTIKADLRLYLLLLEIYGYAKLNAKLKYIEMRRIRESGFSL